MTDHRDTYAPRLKGRSGAWAHPPTPRDTRRKFASTAASVLLAAAFIAVAVSIVLADPMGRITADAVRAESITFPKGY